MHPKPDSGPRLGCFASVSTPVTPVLQGFRRLPQGLKAVPKGPPVVRNTTFGLVRAQIACPIARACSSSLSNPSLNLTAFSGREGWGPLAVVGPSGDVTLGCGVRVTRGVRLASAERRQAVASLAWTALLCWRKVAPGGEGRWMMPHRSRRVPVIADSAFKGFRFPQEIIVLALRWYLRYGRSYRDVEELLGERGIEVDHVTIYRWVQRFTPLLADAAVPFGIWSAIVGLSMRPT